MKTLIAYFSLSGVTKAAAERIQSLTDGDLFEIKGKKNYGSYAKAIAIGGKEIAARELPEVITHVENFASYDRILFGFPVWYGTCPRLIRIFATENDFSGKEVSVFAPVVRQARKSPGKRLPRFAKARKLALPFASVIRVTMR
ncbi:MAG: hypothetical protein LUG99_06955 [Lachnospiraceae bacterium]|nr:hypothetical protein [Lachnospiraceae bacterium]